LGGRLAGGDEIADEDVLIGDRDATHGAVGRDRHSEAGKLGSDERRECSQDHAEADTSAEATPRKPSLVPGPSPHAELMAVLTLAVSKNAQSRRKMHL